MKRLIIAGLLCLSVCGCNRGQWSTLKSWGSRHVITLYAVDGKVIAQYYSTGIPVTEQGGELYFQDDNTGNPVYVYGTYTVLLPSH